MLTGRLPTLQAIARATLDQKFRFKARFWGSLLTSVVLSGLNGLELLWCLGYHYRSGDPSMVGLSYTYALLTFLLIVFKLGLSLLFARLLYHPDQDWCGYVMRGLLFFSLLLDVIYKLAFMRWSTQAYYAGWLGLPYSVISLFSLLMFFDRPGLKFYLVTALSVLSCGLIPLLSVLKLEVPETEKNKKPSPESKSKSFDELPR